MPNQFLNILNFIQVQNMSLDQFIALCFKDSVLSHHPSVHSTLIQLQNLLECLWNHPYSKKAVSEWMDNIIQEEFAEELVNLTRKESSLQFTARNAKPEQFESFKIQGLADNMRQTAPRTWSLVQRLLVADPAVMDRREKRWAKKENKSSDSSERDLDEDPLEDDDEEDLEDTTSDNTETRVYTNEQRQHDNNNTTQYECSA